jgi:hypothetical protein
MGTNSANPSSANVSWMAAFAQAAKQVGTLELTRMIRSLALISVLSLSACGPAGFGDSENDASGVTAPEPEATPLPGAGFEADFEFELTEETVATIVGPDTLLRNFNAEDEALVLSGTSPSLASGGRTGGVAIEISPETVAGFAGRTVTVVSLLREPKERR